MADSAKLSELIARLSSRERGVRESASADLYEMGRALGDAALERWRALPDFARLLVGKPTVGVAVRPESFGRIREANGSPRLAEVPPNQDAMEFELHFGKSISLDILTTKAPGGGGAIARFLEKFGEGIQQVEYLTPDVDSATAVLRERLGQQPIYAETRPGADGTRVNFFLASTPEGKKVLIELVEAPRDTSS